jgi:hypothetical protein
MPSTASYPRPSGVLVPASLAEAGCPVVPGAFDSRDRERAAGEVVAWMRRSLRRLPPQLLETELPEPATILKSWTIGQRTRGSLERIMSAGKGTAKRCVRDYVRASRMGPHGLVDMLSAREEALAPPPSPRLDDPTAKSALEGAARVDELSAAIRSLLPMSAADLGKALVAAGLTTRALSFEDVVDALKEAGLPTPFRVVRRAGATVLVAPENLAAAETLLTSAVHFVFHWGLCTTRALVARLQALTTVSFDDAAVGRVLTSIPQFRWLDEESGWFSFIGPGSRASLAIRKVFAVTARVSCRDLRLALSKQIEAFSDVPERALEAYLFDVAGCAVVDGWVEPRAPLDPAPLGYSERALVELLRRHGGDVATNSLRDEACQLGVTVSTARRLLRTSPLLIETAGRLRLVGVPRDGLLA